MNYKNKNYPFKWFGVWKEYGEGYENNPSVKDFIDYETNNRYNKNKLIYYLDNGVIVASTSKSSFPSPITGEIANGTISFRTDGKWVWLDNISELILSSGLTIPEDWYYEIEKSLFCVPNVDISQLENIAWPSL